MIGYLIAFGIAIAASALAFAILYAIHLRISMREDDRYLNGDDAPATTKMAERGAHRKSHHLTYV